MTLLLRVERKWRKKNYTIGRLWVGGELFCDTLEDTDRGLRQDMTAKEMQRLKVPAKTAIPTGKYNVTLRVYSPKFGAKPFYRKACDGKLPRLLNVDSFDGVLIHCGNTANDTEGCILVGENKVVGGLVNSQATFDRLYKRLKAAEDRGENIQIVIE